MSNDVLDVRSKLEGPIHVDLPVAQLVELAIARGEATLAENGALVVKTGERTGRSPDDRYVVESPTTKDAVWWGTVNRPVSREVFDKLLDKTLAHLRTRDVFVFNGSAGADPAERLPVRVITELAWHNLFARTLFLRHKMPQGAGQQPFTVVDAGTLKAGGPAMGIRSDAFIGLDFDRRLVLVMGTGYAGEMKKSIFAVMNYLLPQRNVLPMHCSANIGSKGDSALFFGLSGTGKTTLSADPSRQLIGDDETGWSDHGIFNVEGGCYAKCINLSKEAEPQIYDAIRFGSVLENVIVDPATRAIDYDDASITENTRATYPVEHIPNCVLSGQGAHAKNVVFLTADAFGVLPPVAKLTRELAMYHYISGYTARLAGTEAGVSEPKAVFSPCFGGPFLPLHPMRYAELLADKLSKHGATCWLINTGWSGGPHGVGQRMKISVSRGAVAAALSGELDKVPTTPDPIFKILIPQSCPGVPGEVLQPRNTWQDKPAYDAKARELAGLFQKNFETYASRCPEEVRNAGPKV